MVVEHSHRIISWQENLPRNEMPPVWMMHLDHELEMWFERVDRDRSNPKGGDDREQVPMAENELAAEMMRSQ